MKPYIRKNNLEWICGSYKETLQYLIDRSIDFDSLDKTKAQAVGQGSSPMAAYQDWAKNYDQMNILLNVIKARNPMPSYELDPRTATGYFLRFLGESFGVKFKPTDTDEEVRKAYFEKELGDERAGY